MEIKKKVVHVGPKFLSFINVQLNTLRGYDLMALELLQNADDAKAKKITFNICDDALYVKLANNMDHLAAHDAASKISTKPELLKHMGFRDLESLLQFVDDSSYEEFSTLRDEVKFFLDRRDKYFQKEMDEFEVASIMVGRYSEFTTFIPVYYVDGKNIGTTNINTLSFDIRPENQKPYNAYALVILMVMAGGSDSVQISQWNLYTQDANSSTSNEAMIDSKLGYTTLNNCQSYALDNNYQYYV